ncbi:Ig-like domain-containing protein [Aeromicrobium wangtongii]|uniref:Ig-like domain repeat protein n=1 Tax=Aeromicrobium wangtongii TaxID=2969247 RepID=A0ABY5M5T9_9ACTN|nr:Ig-like domain-containing protein [Aeromicrobium wangtongii]MCD9199918.1 Ig-like domain repeat protein [Aeromicrobium wangtongii]UUP13535.1 Ig-like domain repeat protein [Aeromicrobium wangtongii]
MTLPLVALPSSAVAADAELASGRNWSVSQAPGGYLVTVDLDKKLPMVSDAPTIEVDGAPIGLATESADGKSLSVFTTDASVAKADDIEAGWFSKPSGETAPLRTSAAAVAPMVVDAETLDADPSSLGKYEITESVYNFGAQAIDLAAIGGVRGEMQGKIYLPKTGGARPTVILLHGRHTSCSTGSSNPLRWPCNPGQINVPSFAGYDGTARALASHGYSVVSIAANAINSNDNELALDRGAQARGQLLLDTLSMLDKANKGEAVSYYDAQTKKDVTLAQALADQSPLPGLTLTTQAMSPADLVGRFDLANVGMMGHSRGGEGVTSAATLNQALAKPWGIKTILPLAPVDFGRMTVPNVAMNVVLPYCDGDVSNQQGQHMLDDSRYAFDDDSLRSGVWAMGANHNFFNTVWTPGVYAYSTSDDWSGTNINSAKAMDSVCGTNPSVAETSIRMSAQEQYDMGTAYMAGWFRLTLGGEKQFLPMFDGSGAVPAVLKGEDVRSVSTAPSSARTTITSFEAVSSLVRPSGAATATVCASAAGRTVPQVLPACTTSINTAAAPHWTPANFGGNVPATPVTKLAWTALSSGQTPSELRVSVPAKARDAGDAERLSVKIAADESVSTGTDLTLSVVDAQGATYSSNVSALNPLAVNRLPASATSDLLKKLVLQQVNVPTSALKDAGLDVSDIREVRFTAATGADGTPAGAVYLSDLAFESSSVGTPSVKTEPTINVRGTSVAEGSGPSTADVAVYLDKAASKPVTGYVSTVGATTGRGGLAMEKVTFAPGETCKIVSSPIIGDKLASSTASTAITTSVTNTAGGVMGAKAFDSLIVREDDGVTGSAVALPAAGVQGSACAELAASRTPGSVTADDPTPAPGGSFTLTAKGYRVGEAVTVSLGTAVLGVVTADGSGTATLTATVPAGTPTGVAAVTAVGSGSGYTSTGSVEVLTATATTLALSPATPGIGEKVTLTASVTGADTAGPVEFFDGATSLGKADTVNGVATLVLDGLKAGAHELTAVFGQTASAQSSTSNIAAVTLEKGKSSIALVLAADSTVYGSGVKGSVAVANGDGGTVTVTYGGTTFDVRLGGSDSAAFTLPAGLAVGTYTVSAVFNGTERVEASGVATAGYRVTKAATTASISAKSSVKGGKKLTVKTTVRGATGGTHPTGRVKVYVKTGKGKYVLKKTVTLSAAQRGAVKATVKVTKKKGTVRVKTVYSGDATYGGAASATRAVRIK